MQTTTERPALGAGAISSTRRRVLSMLGGLTAGSAALSVTVIQPAPAIAEPVSPPATASEELVSLSEEVRVRHQAWIDAGEHLNDVINGLRQWEAENPEPRPYDAEGNSLPAGRWGVWNEEHKAALKRFGKLKALNAYQVASIALKDAIGEVVGFQATTMTDLHSKAELAFECDNDRCDLSTSVIEDLLDMSGGAST